MKRRNAQLRFIYIITGILTVLSIFFSSAVTDAHALGDGEQPAEAASFEELKTRLNENMSTGGTIVLTQDITVSPEESYTFTNGRYRQEITIETQGHTIYVEGYLDLWPYLTIRGDGSQQELLHVCPGGELRLTSVCIDAGENGVAILQEEGSFFLYSSEESMGLPEFSCTGQIISAQTMTAAAYWQYDFEKLPIIRIPEGVGFTPDLLPNTVLALVNRDHAEFEEEVPVIWDESSFPSEQERTIIQGCFTEDYTQYGDSAPKCLVVWESEENPFFLNVYLKQTTPKYSSVFMYGETPQAGTVSIQSSDDGETWTEITGTDGYEPITADSGEELMWLLSYSQTEAGTERPRYYRMVLRQEDGTECYSEVLELTDDFFFTTADIEGGRGGETSPDEGEGQLPDDGIWGSGSSDGSSASNPDSSLDDNLDPGATDNSGDIATETPVSNHGNTEDPSPSNDTLESSLDTESETTSAKTDISQQTKPLEQPNQAEQPNESEQKSQTESSSSQQSGQGHSGQTDQSQKITSQSKALGNVQILIGTGVVICILIGSVVLAVVRKRK